MMRDRYAVVKIEYCRTKKEASAAMEGGGRLYPLAKEKCEKGADHAHALYDGATYCSACGKYLSISISKSEGWARR